MATVQEGMGQEPRGAQAGTATVLESPRWRRTLESFRGQRRTEHSGQWQVPLTSLVQRGWGLVCRHPVFSVALVASVVPRLIAMLGYQPAILFRMDSFDYLWGALHPSPNVINPSGYSLFLWLLLPLHSLVLVAAVQHLMGLVAAVMIYALLRRYGLPGWGATLAAAPVLFDPAQLLLEQLVMADVLAMVLTVAAFAVLLLRERPSWGRLAAAGVLMGLSTIVRPTALPLLVLIPLYLLVRRAGWRRAALALAAGVLPVVAYLGWFDAAHGSFNMTNSNGLFLWTRTMSFANCAVIKPPPDLRALCPEVQPKGLNIADPVKRPPPRDYLWDRRTWQWQPTVRQFVPDTRAFTRANNSRALRFGLRAISAQPLAYAHVIAHETSVPFRQVTNSWRFPVSISHSVWYLPRGSLGYANAAVRGYTRTSVPVGQVLHGKYAMNLKQPYVALINDYQRVIFLPGPLFGLILAAGLAGLLIPGRRHWAAALLWVSAVVVMVLPTAEHEYTYRYLVPAVPLACLAAAFAFCKPRPVAEPAGPGPAEPSPGG